MPELRQILSDGEVEVIDTSVVGTAYVTPDTLGPGLSMAEVDDLMEDPPTFGKPPAVGEQFYVVGATTAFIVIRGIDRVFYSKLKEAM